MHESFDLAIIGAGSGGLAAALTAAQVGARVALIERQRIGGDCTWTGCVPSKALLKAARVAHHARTAADYGIDATLAPVDAAAVMRQVKAIIADVYARESPATLERQGITVVLGAAQFVDAHTLTVALQDGSEQTIKAKHVLICTGARPKLPPVPGLDTVPLLTYEQLFDLETLPRHLLVLGGGPNGVEMAQAFRRLGSAVSIIQRDARLLPRDERDASEVIQRVFEREGIQLQLNTAVTAAEQAADSITLHTTRGSVTGDALLVATGRAPVVDGLALDRAGVRWSAAGIPVNHRLQTNVAHIYAAGDCTGGPQYTHYAAFQAVIATRNALFPGSQRGVVAEVPWTTFTDPEVAHGGLTEAEARRRYGRRVRVHVLNLLEIDRAIVERKTEGFIKVVTVGGRVRGATVVAERAGDIIHEWLLAIAHGWQLDALATTIHTYPTYASGNQQLSAAHAIERFTQGLRGKVARLVTGIGRK